MSLLIVDGFSVKFSQSSHLFFLSVTEFLAGKLLIPKNYNLKDIPETVNNWWELIADF